ncbi:MAG: Rieske (2Fe-2S) protein [Chloroflexota bacterium]|nr:Rieske (2Fe-2S) protein [Chloroflexota bacterium]
MTERRAELLVLLLFGASTFAGFSLLVLYILGGHPQLEGILLTICLGGIGAGIVVWAHRLMPARIHIEKRGPIGGSPQRIEDLELALSEEAGFSRRTLLIRALAGTIAGLGAALAVPVFSLGPLPGRALFETAWRQGGRLAIAGGDPLHLDDLPIGGVLTVFPNGDDSDPNAATLLIRVEPDLLRLPGERAAWAPNGYVAYSKLCTHAGCPVGLYRSSEHILICPCHQSEFDVLDGARPVSGPAARALPQLPIRLQADGTFVALADFPEPVGPGFWDMRS